MNPPSKKAAATLPLVRCAVYTRKSTEEGLEQEFNSLDAQRESAEAFICSQAQEGWTCLPTRYDDGGFTGGNMERPALQRLLADIQAGQIDLQLLGELLVRFLRRTKPLGDLVHGCRCGLQRDGRPSNHRHRRGGRVRRSYLLRAGDRAECGYNPAQPQQTDPLPSLMPPWSHVGAAPQNDRGITPHLRATRQPRANLWRFPPSRRT
jgi:hypothetical protein